jgi:hypothetical protein
VGVTPFLLSREVSRDLLERLRQLHGLDVPDGGRYHWPTLLSPSFRWNKWSE